MLSNLAWPKVLSGLYCIKNMMWNKTVVRFLEQKNYLKWYKIHDCHLRADCCTGVANALGHWWWFHEGRRWRGSCRGYRPSWGPSCDRRCRHGWGPCRRSESAEKRCSGSARWSLVYHGDPANPILRLTPDSRYRTCDPDCWKCNLIYSQACVQRPPTGPKNSGRCWQVVVVRRSFML